MIYYIIAFKKRVAFDYYPYPTMTNKKYLINGESLDTRKAGEIRKHTEWLKENNFDKIKVYADFLKFWKEWKKHDKRDVRYLEIK